MISKINLKVFDILTTVLVSLLILEILVIFGINFSGITSLLFFVHLITVPGLLILFLLKFKKINFWEGFVYAIGLSIAFLIFLGFILNLLLPIIETEKPLTIVPVSIGLNISLFVLWILNYQINKNSKLKIHLKTPNKLNAVLALIPIIFPILSILGAFNLNNMSTNIPIIILLGSITAYVFILVLFRAKVDKNIYPLALFFIALSLLLMTSLRSWYIAGHDIVQEYYVFQLAKNSGLWNISSYDDLYNASLSITILPSIFDTLLNINDSYIYKFFYQIIFSTTAIVVYLFFKKYTTRTIAFLSAFYFVSFPTFLNDLPMLNRQEISLLFFSLMLLILFKKTPQTKIKYFLFSIFAISMILAHYSTSYIAVALITLTFLISLIIKNNFLNLTSFLNKIISKFTKIKKIYTGGKTYFITLSMFILIIFSTVIWNSQIENENGGLGKLTNQAYQNINKIFSNQLKSGDVLYSIFSWSRLDTAQLLEEYVDINTTRIQLQNDPEAYFDNSTNDIYGISNVDDELLESNTRFNTFSFNLGLRQLSAKLIQVFIFIGFIVLLLKKRYFISNVDFEYKIMVFSSIILLVLMITLPLFSIEYGTLRFFQQSLIILALPTTLGVLILFRKLGENISLYITAGLYLIFFMSLSGFIPQLTGNYYPQLHLNNQGTYYDAYYTHKSELASMKWLKYNYSDEFPIQASRFASHKLLAISNLATLEKILPVTVLKESYVFLDYSNVINTKDVIFYKGNLIFYNYPVDFLNNNKNLIYANGESTVFK